jgi:adenylate cyclase
MDSDSRAMVIPKGRVLIVEERANQVGSISRMLDLSDYEVTSARIVDAVIEIISKLRPDVVVLDNLSTGRAMLELIELIKLDQDSKDVPLVFISELDDYDSIIRAVELGVDEYLTRPLEQSSLLVRLGTAQEKKWLKKKAEAYINILDEERLKSDKLLFSILPGSVAERLKNDPGVIAESYAETTVMFADIVGFTELASKMSPTRVVTFLNDVFSVFDNLADKHGLEKIKTIGDAYMVAGGVPNKRPDHAEAMGRMALDMLSEVSNVWTPEGGDLRLRIGIHTGPAVAGVIGRKRFIYDLWGDTVNIASRMESQGLPDRIQVSEATYQKLRKDFMLEKRGMLHIKGKGQMITWLLTAQKEAEVAGDEAFAIASAPGEAAKALKLAQEELESLTLVDEATGLYTRRGFVSMVSQLFKLATRENRGMLLLMVNMDNLADIKRTHGVTVGEEALLETGMIFNRTFRTHDIAARIGENRFVVVGMEVTQAPDDILAFRLTSNIDEFNQKAAHPYKIMVSMTSARWDPKMPRDLDDILLELEEGIWEKVVKTDEESPS